MKQLQSFETVYEENFKYVYNYVYMQLLNRQMAEDIVSDVFLRAMQHYDAYDAEKSAVKTWLCTIARNQLTDYYRSKRRQCESSVDEISEQNSYVDEYKFLQDESNKELFKILSCLTENERELLNMKYNLELKNADIAAALGIQPKAVCERCRRVIKKCRDLLRNKTFSDFC